MILSLLKPRNRCCRESTKTDCPNSISNVKLIYCNGKSGRKKLNGGTLIYDNLFLEKRPLGKGGLFVFVGKISKN